MKKHKLHMVSIRIGVGTWGEVLQPIDGQHCVCDICGAHLAISPSGSVYCSADGDKAYEKHFTSKKRLPIVM